MSHRRSDEDTVKMYKHAAFSPVRVGGSRPGEDTPRAGSERTEEVGYFQVEGEVPEMESVTYSSEDGGLFCCDECEEDKARARENLGPNPTLEEPLETTTLEELRERARLTLERVTLTVAARTEVEHMMDAVDVVYAAVMERDWPDEYRYFTFREVVKATLE